MQDATELVERSLLAINGNESLPTLAKLASSAFAKVRGDESRSVLHIYNVDASGENANGKKSEGGQHVVFQFSL